MIDDKRRLIAAVTKFEDLLTSLQAVRARQDSERGKALVALRRQLAEQVAEIAALARPLFDQRGDATEEQQFRHLHSTLMSALALHQANWPAVEFVKADFGSGYRQSAQTVDNAASALGRWIRDKLDN